MSLAAKPRGSKAVRRVLWFCGGVLAVLLLALGVIIACEWPYIQRVRTYPEKPITTVAWHQPKVAVPGAFTTDLPVAAPGEITIAATALSNAVQYADEKNSSALLVLHRDRIVAEHYWRGHDATRWSDSASMAKTLVALLTGIAVGEGTLKSIDEPAANRLPAWAGDERGKITLRHLLQMSSGLRPQGEYTDPFSDACYLALGGDNRYIVDHVPAVTEPGKVHDYNNANFQALGFVLEQAAGKPYPALLSEKLWQPLGNRDAALWLDRPGGSARTFGFVFATARDWARVGLLILHEGRVNGRQVVPAAWVREMCEPSPMNPAYGMGIYTGPDGGDETPFLAKDTVALNGSDKQRVYVIPSRDLVIVRIGEQARKWDDGRLPNLVVEGVRQ